MLVLGFTALVAGPAGACNCDCYYAFVEKDCGTDAGVICNRDKGCTARKPKPHGVKGAGCNENNDGAAACDGICEKSKGSCLGEDAGQVSKGLRLWTNAYFKAARRGGGQPDPALVARAMTAPSIVNPACRDEIRTAAINTQAFSFTNGGFVPPGPGGPHGSVPGIVDACGKAAARFTGRAVAIEVKAPGQGRLARFIDRIGLRCTGVPEMPIGPCADTWAVGVDPLDCQKAEMQGLVQFVSVPSLCGNGVIDPGEECEQDADCGGPGNLCGGCSCAEGCAVP
jgi:hypothetical protein